MKASPPEPEFPSPPGRGPHETSARAPHELPAPGASRIPPIPAHPRFEPLGEEVVWNGRFPLQRVRFRYRRSDGTLSRPLTWELWRRGPGGVLVLPWDPARDRVALVEQFRLPALAANLDPIQRECPAGLLEPGEDPLPAARRELEEETGLLCDRAELFGRFLLTPGGSDEMLGFVLARVSLPSLGHGAPAGLEDEAEETRLLVVTADDALAMLDDGRIQGAPAALALLWLANNRDRLRPDWSIP